MLAEVIGSKCLSGAQNHIKDVGPAREMDAGILCFAVSQNALSHVTQKSAGIIITSDELASLLPPHLSVIAASSPRKSFAMALSCLLDDTYVTTSRSDIHASAQIAPSAVIGTGVVIGPDTIVAAGAVIGDGVVIGAGCRIGANAVLGCTVLQDQVWIGPGAVIGDTGFGFEMDDSGPVHLPHVGIVSVGTASRIGANTTIDRGSLSDTRIGKAVMIDNLVHIAHNCVIGDHSIIASQVGIAGSTVIGKQVLIGGQAGIADHLTIGDGAVLTARAGITTDVPPGAKMAGFPAEEAGKFWRRQAKLRAMTRPPKANS